MAAAGGGSAAALSPLLAAAGAAGPPENGRNGMNKNRRPSWGKVKHTFACTLAAGFESLPRRRQAPPGRRRKHLGHLRFVPSKI